MRLTNTACKNAKPKEKAYKLADGGGLYLEVMPSGSRSISEPLRKPSFFVLRAIVRGLQD